LSRIIVPTERVSCQETQCHDQYAPILASGNAMKVNYQLESILAGPLYSVLKVRQLALYVWLSRADIKGPVSDR
jgi:hypothetical protein